MIDEEREPSAPFVSFNANEPHPGLVSCESAQGDEQSAPQEGEAEPSSADDLTPAKAWELIQQLRQECKQLRADKRGEGQVAGLEEQIKSLEAERDESLLEFARLTKTRILEDVGIDPEKYSKFLTGSSVEQWREQAQKLADIRATEQLKPDPAQYSPPSFDEKRAFANALFGQKWYANPAQAADPNYFFNG